MVDEPNIAARGTLQIGAPLPVVNRVGPARYDGERSIWEFKGRITRSKFWLRSLLAGVAGGATIFVSSLAWRTLVTGGLLGQILGAILCLVALAGWFFCVWLNLGTQVKRWHDLNLSSN